MRGACCLALLIGLVSMWPDSIRAQMSLSRGLEFVRNDGQWDRTVCFASRHGDGWIVAEGDALGMCLERRCPDAVEGVYVRLVVEGASKAAPVVGEEVQTGERNYFVGNDPSRWATRVPAFARVRWLDILPGVDLVARTGAGDVEYDFELDPGANLESLVVRVEGASRIRPAEDGAMLIDTRFGSVSQAMPKTWQVHPDGTREDLGAACVVLDRHRFAIDVPGWTRTLPLVIDPGLSWATFLGGAGGEDDVRDLQRTAGGDILAAGWTYAADFPIVPGSYDIVNGGIAIDVFVSCLASDGSGLIFSTFLGGTQSESTHGFSMGPNGEVAIAGATNSVDFPTTPGALSATFGGGPGFPTDAFVAVLDSTGSQLLYGTYLGGTGNEHAYGVVSDSIGHVTVAGMTCSTNFPVTPGAFDTTLGGCDAFVTTLDPTQTGPTQLVASTFLGGGIVGDEARGLFVTSSGSYVVFGFAENGFPVTAGAYDTEWTAGSRYITRLSQDLSTVEASTFAPIDGTAPNNLSLGPGDSIVAASAAGGGMPVTPGAFDTMAFGTDAVALRMDADLTTIEMCTYIGGSSSDYGQCVTALPDGSVVIGGYTRSTDWPTTPGASDTTYSGGFGDPFVAVVSTDGTQLLYSTFLGGSTAAIGEADVLAADGDEHVLVGGRTPDALFPVTPGAFDTSFNGGILGDGFVARLRLESAWDNLGDGLLGTQGVPVLAGAGGLCVGEIVTLTLTRAKANGIVALVAGLAELDLPFKGGTLVPAPDVVIVGLQADAAGQLVLAAPWPVGVPSGLELYWQEWIVDPVGPKGFAASNALRSTVP